MKVMSGSGQRVRWLPGSHCFGVVFWHSSAARRVRTALPGDRRRWRGRDGFDPEARASWPLASGGRVPAPPATVTSVGPPCAHRWSLGKQARGYNYSSSGTTTCELCTRDFRSWINRVYFIPHVREYYQRKVVYITFTTNNSVNFNYVQCITTISTRYK